MSTEETTKEVTYHARLENWVFDFNGRLYGNIFDDIQKRFHDAAIVTTSPVVSGSVEEGQLIVTYSGTIYLLGRRR